MLYFSRNLWLKCSFELEIKNAEMAWPMPA